MSGSIADFSPAEHRSEITSIIEEIERSDSFDQTELEGILRRYPKDGTGFFSKAEIISGFRYLNRELGWNRDEGPFLQKIRMKPIRTLSGVAPVTVLTKPFPCPGQCIFCPSDVRMPKSYLSDEPGAQRAAEHQFDPYDQTASRLRAYWNIGHPIDKIELIILGGTWSYYPEPYQIWFVKRCFEALNDFRAATPWEPVAKRGLDQLDFREITETVDRRRSPRNYNQIVNEVLEGDASATAEVATWDELLAAHTENESADARCVGLVVETRPDHLTDDEVVRIRRLGGTKVQIGYQSLSDEVLSANHRGHDIAATKRAMAMLRSAGFKIHAHWMPNLYGSSPDLDVRDFVRIFEDPSFRPDELKIYPCSLIASAELMRYYEDGRWRPYSYEELLFVLTECIARTPEYCRLTRVVRDIPGTDIEAGNLLTNFREIAERALDKMDRPRNDIRSREVRALETDLRDLRLEELEYETSSSREVFLQYVTAENRIAAFLRLALPFIPSRIREIAASAMIREVHVYGRLVEIGDAANGRSQHAGLGRRLVERAVEIGAEAGFDDVAVISSIGTRPYYRSLGFVDGELYQHRAV